MKRLVNEKGLTLIEAVIAATLMAVVLCGSLLLYERGVRDWLWTEEYTEVVDNLRIAADKVASEARGAKASSVVILDEGKTLGFEDSTTSTAVYYRFDETDGELERNYQPVTTGVITGVYFSQPGPGVVKIELRGRGVKTGEVSVRTMVYARNS
jgi:Tfp pilus assembly protein PilW